MSESGALKRVVIKCDLLDVFTWPFLDLRDFFTWPFLDPFRPFFVLRFFDSEFERVLERDLERDLERNRDFFLVRFGLDAIAI